MVNSKRIALIAQLCDMYKAAYEATNNHVSAINTVDTYLKKEMFSAASRDDYIDLVQVRLGYE